MPGLYNNETSLYEEASWMRDGTWGVDDRYQLYIICDPKQGIAENEGPDNRKNDSLNRMMREERRSPLSAMKRAGLRIVKDEAKGFSPDRGYYVIY